MKGELFSFIDRTLSERLSGSVNPLICYLSLASRMGHLCVSLGEKILPDPAELLPESEGGAELERLIRRGAEELPGELLSLHPSSEGSEGLICKWKENYYFERYWRCESKCLEQLSRLQKEPPSLKIDPERALSRLLNRGELTEEQAEAIRTVCRESLSIISGGPGTGKSYTAGKLIEVLSASLGESCEIVIAAPTGKAAANLQRYLGAGSFQATTLHKLLAIAPFKKKRAPLFADLVLVDESSMIDVELMAELLSSVRSGSRLLLLGDHRQLPPVEAGSLFADMIPFCKGASELHRCLRAESSSLVEFAQMIDRGEADRLLSFIESRRPVLQRSPLDREKLLERVLCSSPFFHEGQPEELLEQLGELILLTPLREGPFGADSLNRALYERHSALGRERLVSPILITKNDPRLGLFNGDLGVLVRERRGSYFLFPHKEKPLAAPLISRYELAYCMTVHKSQGSEFNKVLFVLPKGSEAFGKELFYTAATRAKREFFLMGEESLLLQVASKKSARHSGFKGAPLV